MVKKQMLRKAAAMALSCLLMLSMGAVAFAEESIPADSGYEEGVVGGAQPGDHDTPSTGEGSTDVWAGVSVDYMFPLRYEVYDADGNPLEGVSIEHYDYTLKEYIYVGRTDANGVWETEVPPSYWMKVIIGYESSGETGAKVVNTDTLYSGDGPLRHRVSKDGFVLVEGEAEYTIENIEGQGATVVIRINMQRSPAGGGDTGGSPALPQTGVQNYWIYFAAGSLLLLLAAAILYKVLKEEKKKHPDTPTTGGQSS